MKNKINKNKKREYPYKDHINEKISFNSNSYLFHLNNSDYFLAISDLNQANGIDLIKNILIFSEKIEKRYNSFETAISSLKSDKKLIGTYIAQKSWETINYHIESSEDIHIISFFHTNLKLESVSENLLMNESTKGFLNGKLDLGQIIIIDKVLSLKNLIKYYKIAIETRMKYFERLKVPKHIQNIVYNNEFLVLTSIIPETKVNEKNSLSYIFNDYFEENLYQEKHSYNKDKNLDDIEKDLKKTIIQSCDKNLKIANISFGILDYMKAEGVSIDALVDAGMELLVGVENSQRLRKKLKNQLLKSLEDLNVIALLMSAIRCEDDFQKNRVREVDVSDDPAYLYTDEVLGIAIANQIAGTKAIFNFKRYDEEKPGIIANLGPMLDDIFAGLVAGCMSKIFEDE